MATLAPITGAPIRAPFNPADWLSRFESFGGAYALTGDTPRLMIIVPDRSDAEISTARRMIVALHPSELQEVLAHVREKDDVALSIANRCCHHGNPDAAILDAWERRKAAYARYNALPFSDDLDRQYSPAEAMEWEIIDAAEELIRSTLARTPRGVAIQIWVMLAHSCDRNDDDAALTRGDLAYFDGKGDEADWNVRLAVAALRSLEAMEG